jgi:hypothetical protein
MTDWEKQMPKNLVNAFNDGYRLGVEYGRSLYGIKRRIKVKQYSPVHAIEFMRLDDGTIHNYGRSIPF